MEEEFESILAIIDEIKSEDRNIQLYAINSLDEISFAIGEERTREELIPYITDLLVDSNEETLLALASKLKELADLIGGNDEISCLLPPLHKLVTNEDPSVREQAVESINEISTRIPYNKIQKSIIPVIEDLAKSDWYSARISVCSMIHIVYEKAEDSTKKSLIEIFILLSKDDSSMVRRAAASNLYNIIQLENTSKIEELFTVLSKDPHDSVRQMCLESLIKSIKINTNLLFLLKTYIKDESWRVRYTLLEKLKEIAVNYPNLHEIETEILLMINDPEPEIRSMALDQIHFLAENSLEPDFAVQILPLFEELSKDSSEYVRISVMQSMCELSKFLGEETAISQILPYINKLVKDEIFEVRMTFAENLSSFIEALSQEKIVTFVVPLLNELMNDAHWRVRLKVVENLPVLAEILGFMAFAEHVSRSLLKWVEDPVYAVRVACLDVFKQLLQLFGPEWVKMKVLPLFNILSSNPIITKRMTALKIAEELGEVFSEEDCLEVYSKLAHDSVPNIRFGVAKGIKALKNKFGKGEKVLKILQTLKEDSDEDVRYFSEVAISQFSQNEIEELYLNFHLETLRMDLNSLGGFSKRLSGHLEEEKGFESHQPIIESTRLREIPNYEDISQVLPFTPNVNAKYYSLTEPRRDFNKENFEGNTKLRVPQLVTKTDRKLFKPTSFHVTGFVPREEEEEEEFVIGGFSRFSSYNRGVLNYKLFSCPDEKSDG